MIFEVGTIAIGSDHRARDTVDSLGEYAESLGWKISKHYGDNSESVDYPLQAVEVASEILEGRAICGVLICGSGIGMSMAANKVDGIRAALVHESVAAEMSRRHNNANVLCMAAESPFKPNYSKILQTWLSAPFEGGRHQRRIDLMR